MFSIYGTDLSISYIVKDLTSKTDIDEVIVSVCAAQCDKRIGLC